MKLLLDTNVLIDYLARRKPFFSDALLLREAALFGDVELWCSLQSFTDAEYILRGALPIETLRSALEACLHFMHAIAPSPDDLQPGLNSDWPDLEDYLIASCAKRLKADYLITRDVQCFYSSSIPALAPAAFITLLAEDYGISYDEVEF